jgi:hypothetical protein
MFEACIRMKKIMDKFGFPWFIEGEWAIDLFLKRETGIRENIEIGIYRRNQMQLNRFFEKSRKYFIDNTSRIGKQEKREWKKEYLQLPINELYVEYAGLQMRILLNEKIGNDWIYGRKADIKLDANRVIQLTDDGIPYVCPEIVLLHKAKNMRDEDMDVISDAIRAMDESRKKWLVDSIEDENTKGKIRNLAMAST